MNSPIAPPSSRTSSNIKRSSIILLAVIVSGISVCAQGYPNVPADIMEASRKERAEAAKLSDEAWKRALPEIEAWAKKGKPYLPSAAKPEDLPQAKIPAFPGAWGGGMYSFGGRGGKVIVVSNLNDSGPGSFREAVEQGGPRIVVFNVAGVIRLKAAVSIRAPYITIAGNTAPGDGICIAGNTVQLDTHDVVVRHMRFRRGKTEAADRDDSFGGNPIGNIMIDHVSASWSLDENISMYRHMYRPPGGDKDLKLPTVNVTIQNSISSESLNIYHHAFGSTIGGLNSTFHHNLWACNTGRNPSVGMYGDFTFVNNVLFNWRHRTVDGGDHKSLYNVINNYFKPGPGTPKSDIAFRFLKPESERSKTVVDNFGKAYVNGNIAEGNERVTKDNWDGGVQPDSRGPRAEVLAKIRANSPFAHAPLQIQPADKAYETVLANAGATLPKRDSVDERIINQVRTGVIPPLQIAKGSQDKAKLYGYAQRFTDELAESVKKGFITDPSEVGGWPEYKGTPYKDSDNDGLPDDWEKKHNLNPNDAADAVTDANGDGYTNIEDFINGLDPKAKPVDWAVLKNNPSW
ncbi:MAG: polysaccharide lyase [Verrucomicrobiota bacterium]